MIVRKIKEALDPFILQSLSRLCLISPLCALLLSLSEHVDTTHKAHGKHMCPWPHCSVYSASSTLATSVSARMMATPRGLTTHMITQHRGKAADSGELCASCSSWRLVAVVEKIRDL